MREEVIQWIFRINLSNAPIAAYIYLQREDQEFFQTKRFYQRANAVGMRQARKQTRRGSYSGGAVIITALPVNVPATCGECAKLLEYPSNPAAISRFTA